jgi:hypothetical protein
MRIGERTDAVWVRTNVRGSLRNQGSGRRSGSARRPGLHPWLCVVPFDPAIVIGAARTVTGFRWCHLLRMPHAQRGRPDAGGCIAVHRRVDENLLEFFARGTYGSGDPCVDRQLRATPKFRDHRYVDHKFAMATNLKLSRRRATHVVARSGAGQDLRWIGTTGNDTTSAPAECKAGSARRAEPNEGRGSVVAPPRGRVVPPPLSHARPGSAMQAWVPCASPSGGSFGAVGAEYWSWRCSRGLSAQRRSRLPRERAGRLPHSTASAPGAELRMARSPCSGSLARRS